jgi:hypothetical protein
MEQRLSGKRILITQADDYMGPAFAAMLLSPPGAAASGCKPLNGIDSVCGLQAPPMGAGTVAVARDGYLFIGSYIGDRIIRVAVRK